MNSLPISVLIVEPYPLMRAALCAAIEAEPDMQVMAATETAAQALPLATLSRPDVLLIALGRAGQGEVAVLRDLRRAWPDLWVLAVLRDETAGPGAVAHQAGVHAWVSQAAPRCEVLAAVRGAEGRRAGY